MKKFTLLLFSFLFTIMVAKSQVKAIFVNDNSENQENSLIVYGLLEQYLGTLVYFDAIQNKRSPNYEELKPYNLVIWYCGSDEDDLYFWNGNYQDNPHLIEYLNNRGNLWSMGRGFLNARYIKPPRTFNDGTFLNDYLGIKGWLSESYTSDNGIGSPELALYNGTPLNTLTLKKIEWKSPPEPLVDGCGLVEGCYNAYIFAPAGYPLYGQPTAFYFPSTLFKNTTFTFDPVSMNSIGNLSTLLSDVLRFYEDILSDVDDFAEAQKSLKIFPNPAADILNIEFNYPGESTLKLSTLQGMILKQNIDAQANGSILKTQLSIGDLDDGVYLLSVETEDGVFNRKVIVKKNDF